MSKLLKRAILLQNKIDNLKKAYEELDSIKKELLKRNFSGRAIDGYNIVIVDNFVDKHVVFRTTGVSRYDLSITKKAKND